MTSDKVPDIVYHYCSVDTFLKIIQNKTIRCSNIFKMNDYSEVLHVLRPLQLVFEEAYEKEPFSFSYNALLGKEAFVQIVLDIKKDIEASKFLTYIACFSEKDDDLGQWRAYGDNGKGVVIGLDGKTLFNLTNQYAAKNCPVELINVSYSDDEQKDFLKRSFVPSIFKALKTALDNGNVRRGFCTYENMVRIMLSSEIAALLLAAVRFKHSAYIAEVEWRLCLTTSTNSTWIETDYRKFKGDKEYPMIEFEIRSDKLISFFDLSFQDSAPDIIKKIIIGPKSQISVDDTDIRLLLKMNGFNIGRSAIIHSEIPYS